MQDLGACHDLERLCPIRLNQDNIATQTRKKIRSFKSPAKNLPTYYKQQKRSEPTNIISDDSFTATIYKPKFSDLLWVIARIINCKDQNLSGLSGWVSQTGGMPKCLTSIGYYPMINSPITELATIQECLRCSQAASAEAGQEYTICTMDLGVCMKAYPLVWAEPAKYHKHIILIGTFHTCGAYLKGIGKRYCQGSGWLEVALEAKLISTGSVTGVTEGKNWDRAMNTHKSMLEALERLLYEKFLETHAPLSQEKYKELLKIAMNKSKLTEMLSSHDVFQHISDYQSFRKAVHQGELGETGQLWIEYMDCTWLVLSMNNAIKTNDYDEYKAILKSMPDLFFCSDQQNYARFLTYLGYFLENIEKTHPKAEKLLRAGAISVSR